MNQFQLTIKQPLQQSRGMAPLRQLSALQRIGYLGELSEIRCCNSFETFKAGAWYKVLTSLVQVIRWDERRNLDGVVERIELTGQELAVILVDDAGDPRCFMDRRFVSDKIVISEGIKPEFGFDRLADSFHLPEPPSVSELYPEKHKRMLQRLRSLESIIRCVRPENRDFTFTGYQMEDLACSAVRDGFIMAWMTGLGKAIGLISWALIKSDIRVVEHKIVPQFPILLATLGDLKAQVVQEAMEKFGIGAWSLDRPIYDPDAMPNKLFIASYEEMARSDMALTYAKAFEVVLVDEATKIKAGSTAIGQAVRTLNPKYRCVATATPVKNRVQDLFWLLHWSAGGKSEAHRAFPFEGTPEGLKKFETLYMLRERNLTREASRGRRKQKKPSAEVCNLHNLWKITSALIIRRRKEDVPECRTKKIEHVIHVPMGTEQARAYKALGEAEWLTVGQKLMALRQAAVCPVVGGLTPKALAVLKAILLCVSNKQQVIVFSAFNAMSDLLAQRLKEVKIETVTLDGRAGQAKRAVLAQRFKNGHPYAMLAGEGSMSYGHNFPDCSNVIMTSEDWAMDLVGQAPDRAHRLNSKRDLNVYRFITRGTIEQRINNLHQDKLGAAEMVLDAQVPNEIVPTDLTEIDVPLEIGETVDEWELEAEWKGLIK